MILSKKSKKKFKGEKKSSDDDLIFLGQDSMGIKNDLLKSEKKKHIEKTLKNTFVKLLIFYDFIL